jgi:hypothetical protein
MRNNDAGTASRSSVSHVKPILFWGVTAQLLLVLLLPAALVFATHRSLLPAAGRGTAQRSLIRVCYSPYRKPDGRIVRVMESGTVIINLGAGDAAAPGMTFESHGDHTSIPDPGSGVRAVSPPPGKASIEVVRILPGYSECRVTRLTSGEGIDVGDPLYQHANRSK